MPEGWVRGWGSVMVPEWAGDGLILINPKMERGTSSETGNKHGFIWDPEITLPRLSYENLAENQCLSIISGTRAQTHNDINTVNSSDAKGIATTCTYRVIG